MVKSKFVILSIDGGGIRGLIPIQVLKHIENLLEIELHNFFDLFAGTSTGGLIACGINLEGYKKSPDRKYKIEEIEKIYKSKGDNIFPDSKNTIARAKNFVSDFFRPQFDSQNLEIILEEYFGNSRMTSCIKPIFITSYDMYSRQPIFFTYREADTEYNKNPLLFDICRATSAAPTYFAPHQMNFGGQNLICVDGGIIMNNPAMGSLIEVLGNSSYKRYKLNGEKINLKDICILSLGTGETNKDFNLKLKKGGKAQWVRPIIDITMESPSMIAHQQLKTIFKAYELENNYLRININVEKEFSEMSDSREETVNYLIEKMKTELVTNNTLNKKILSFLNNCLENNIA